MFSDGEVFLLLLIVWWNLALKLQKGIISIMDDGREKCVAGGIRIGRGN
jgi:hypothetical protein